MLQSCGKKLIFRKAKLGRSNVTLGENVKIGILGGTFDPIHYGHLIIAEEIREFCKLDKVIFIPTGLPPHKTGRRVTDPEHRYNMLTAATASNPKFDVSRVEIDREGYTYTVDTLKQLKGIYGQNSEVFFITGADVIHELLTWKEYMQVFTMCEFIAAFRPGIDREVFVREINSLQDNYSAKIHMVETPVIDISSTDIRKRICDNKTIKYLVPESIEDYIRKFGLYKNLY